MDPRRLRMPAPQRRIGRPRIATLPEIPTIEWVGESGKVYQYWTYPLGVAFDANPGNYIFSMKITHGVFRVLYVGETDDLSKRFDDPHNLVGFHSSGVTHVHVHASPCEALCRRVEADDITAKWCQSVTVSLPDSVVANDVERRQRPTGARDVSEPALTWMDEVAGPCER